VTALANSEAVMMPRDDFHSHARWPPGTAVEPAPIVVVEGIFGLFNLLHAVNSVESRHGISGRVKRP